MRPSPPPCFHEHPSSGFPCPIGPPNGERRYHMAEIHTLRRDPKNFDHSSGGLVIKIHATPQKTWRTAILDGADGLILASLCLCAYMLICAMHVWRDICRSRARVLRFGRGFSQSERVRCTGTNMLLCFWAFVYFTMCASMLLSE